MTLAYYLTKRLAGLGLRTDDINQLGYLEIYSRLKANEPSLGFQALFDLYRFCLHDASSKQLSLDKQQELISAYKQLPPQHPSLAATTIEQYLAEAIKEAKQAAASGEVPIGAVVVSQQQIIGRGHNQTRKQQSVLAHAEIMAIEQAQLHLNNFRLTECDLYVTLEPCLMCSGAIIHSRIRRLIYAASEPKTGACHSQYQVFANRQVNHHCQVIGPVAQHYQNLLQEFFRPSS